MILSSNLILIFLKRKVGFLQSFKKLEQKCGQNFLSAKNADKFFVRKKFVDKFFADFFSTTKKSANFVRKFFADFLKKICPQNSTSPKLLKNLIVASEQSTTANLLLSKIHRTQRTRISSILFSFFNSVEKSK